MATNKKNPALKAKREAAYAARCAKLQADQQRANSLKSEFDYTGRTPDQVFEQHWIAEGQRQEAARKAADEARRVAFEREQQEQAQYVVDALNGPSAKVLKLWLKDRVATYERVKRFFDERPAQHRIAQIVKAA